MLIYRRTKNLRAVQLLLGHSKLESTVRYLGIRSRDLRADGNLRRAKVTASMIASGRSLSMVIIGATTWALSATRRIPGVGAAIGWVAQ